MDWGAGGSRMIQMHYVYGTLDISNIVYFVSIRITSGSHKELAT